MLPAMSTHTARLSWQRQAGEAFTDLRYHRSHTWHFDGGAVVPAAASPHVVRVPLTDPTAVDPEEAFAASLAACHLLWFLHLAGEAGWVVDDYQDEAVATLGPDAERQLAIVDVLLRPRVRFAGAAPDAAAHAALHDAAHAACFLARSVRCPVRCEPTRV
jgi:organic hydroperoxide reductase OsmC/OhrA